MAAITKKLAGKVAVVTGASKGIGAAIARESPRLARRSSSTTRRARTQPRTIVKEITGKDGKAVAVQANLATEVDVRRLFAETKKAFGRVDILVNNAGIYEFAPLEAVTAEHFHKQFDLNVLGLILATQEAVKLFPATGGSIINISSVVATGRIPNSSVYSATKAAVEAVTRSLAAELGPRKIRVNSINPGMVETEGLHAAGIVRERFPQADRATDAARPHRATAGHRSGSRLPRIGRFVVDHGRIALYLRRYAISGSDTAWANDWLQLVPRSMLFG